MSTPTLSSLLGGLSLAILVTCAIYRIYHRLYRSPSASASAPSSSTSHAAAARKAARSRERPLWKGEKLKMVLCVRNDIGMGKGKMMAQCCHAAVGVVTDLMQTEPELVEHWNEHGAMKIATKVQSEEELLELERAAIAAGLANYLVIDAGHTQIAPDTKTVLSIGPGPSSKIDLITGKLKLMWDGDDGQTTHQQSHQMIDAMNVSQHISSSSSSSGEAEADTDAEWWRSWRCPSRIAVRSMISAEPTMLPLSTWVNPAFVINQQLSGLLPVISSASSDLSGKQHSVLLADNHLTATTVIHLFTNGIYMPLLSDRLQMDPRPYAGRDTSVMHSSLFSRPVGPDCLNIVKCINVSANISSQQVVQFGIFDHDLLSGRACLHELIKG